MCGQFEVVMYDDLSKEERQKIDEEVNASGFWVKSFYLTTVEGTIVVRNAGVFRRMWAFITSLVSLSFYRYYLNHRKKTL